MYVTPYMLIFLQLGEVMSQKTQFKVMHKLRCVKAHFHGVNPQSPEATVCCSVGAAALVHLRPGGPGLPNWGFKGIS